MSVIYLITNRLKELREAKVANSSNPSEWTQESLGLRVGVTRQTIISIERGKYNPTLELAFKIAHEFGMTIDEIFEYMGDNNEP
ncbi:MAG: helix-turn-helix transcriptional regulator [Candidatus Thorarchaeota archaeon]|nr:helix-turn-helix transcriptional regulator [Candidatus Thorarchaeota archaeon]